MTQTTMQLEVLADENRFDALRRNIAELPRKLGGPWLDGSMKQLAVMPELYPSIVPAVAKKVSAQLHEVADALDNGDPAVSDARLNSIVATYRLVRDGVPEMRERQLGPLKVRQVFGRAERPKGVAGVRAESLNMPLGENDKRFDRPSISHECLLRAMVGSLVIEFYPNLCPYALKSLLVHARRDVDDPANQFLTEEKNEKNIPCNLFYGDRLYHVARTPLSQVEPASWSSGFAWLEIGGVALAMTVADLLRMTLEDIIREFAKYRID